MPPRELIVADQHLADVCGSLRIATPSSLGGTYNIPPEEILCNKGRVHNLLLFKWYVLFDELFYRRRKMGAWLNSHHVAWILPTFFVLGYCARDALKSSRRGRAISQNIDKMKNEDNKSLKENISKI